MKVLKFGGSSIGSPDNILLVLAIIKEKANTKDPISVIFSAIELHIITSFFSVMAKIMKDAFSTIFSENDV